MLREVYLRYPIRYNNNHRNADVLFLPGIPDGLVSMQTGKYDAAFPDITLIGEANEP